MVERVERVEMETKTQDERLKQAIRLLRTLVGTVLAVAWGNPKL